MQMDLLLQYHNHILNEREKCKEEGGQNQNPP